MLIKLVGGKMAHLISALEISGGPRAFSYTLSGASIYSTIVNPREQKSFEPRKNVFASLAWGGIHIQMCLIRRGKTADAYIATLTFH